MSQQTTNPETTLNAVPQRSTWSHPARFLCGLLVLICLLNPAILLGQVKNTKKERPATVKKAAIIQFKGPIDYKLFSYFQAKLAQAKSSNVDLLILDINSPGGLLEESLQMAHKLSEVDWAHTVAYVSKEAISGAALVALGCDDIVVGENVLFGDIGAIYQENDGAFRYIPAKLNSYLVQEAANLAEAKGRSRELAEAMIDKDVLVYSLSGADDQQFKTVRADEKNKPLTPWVLIDESKSERFLTVNGGRALELGLADSMAGNREALEAQFNFDLDKTREYRYTTKDSVVFYLNTPLITGVLIVVGLIALYIELSAPGIGAGGLVSGLCATLFFWSRFMGGTSGWLEVLLFLAGMVFLVFELFIIPGFGVSGLMGLILLVSSVVMASQDFVIPETQGQWNQVVTTLLMLMCSGTVVAIAAAFITKRLGSIPVFGRLILAPTRKDETETGGVKTDADGKPIPQSHPDVSIGDWGTAESLLRPAGRAKFNRKSFDVVSDGNLIDPGQPIKVVEIRGNRIVVSEVDDLIPETTYPTKSDSVADDGEKT